MHNILATLTTFAATVVVTFVLLPVLRKLKAGQQILCYVTEHAAKAGTPTMGGIGFVLTVALFSLLFCNVDRVVVIVVLVFVAYAVIGFFDDFVKVRFQQNQGLKAYQKIAFQLSVAVIVALYAYGSHSVGSSLFLPFTADKTIALGVWVVPLVVFVFVACTNGVNLTDGIDGLATTSAICYLGGMLVLLVKHRNLCQELGDTYGAQITSNLVTVCCVGIGALCAFLLFNANDAKVFMGDTGSLALGALVACVAIFSRLTLFVPIVGLTFVVSCVSVVAQVVYFRFAGGKRLFLMAPFHHHLQHKGWSETRICVLYAVVTVVATLVLLCFGE